MKLQLASDLHFEFYEKNNHDQVASRLVETTDADVLILAGDVANLADGSVEQYLRVFLGRYRNVIYVPGNHDWWAGAYSTNESVLRALDTSYDNLHVLCHATQYEVTLEGQRFVGDTLWVPDTPNAHMTRTNDLRFMPDLKTWIFDKHELFKSWLGKNLRETDVLVTHYLPTWGCVAPEYRGSPLNAWFVGDIEGIIADKQPKLTVFGHTHYVFSGMIGETRVLCNPAGYPGEPDQGYNRVLTRKV